MNGPTPGNWLSKITGAATTVLGAAIALYVAVHLIESVATALLVLGIVALIAGFISKRKHYW